MKRILWTSVLVVLIPTLMFAPLYVLLISTAQTSLADYRSEVIGSWAAIQYYENKQRIPCDEDQNIYVTFGDDRIQINGTVLPETDSAIEWKSGTSLFATLDAEQTVLYLGFVNFNNLKITVGADGIIVLLRRIGG